MTNFESAFTRKAVYLAAAYGIGKPLGEKRISGGHTSDAIRLDTEQGSFVLRKLSGIAQAHNEYRVSQALQGKKICPEILTAQNGQGWMQLADGFYNMQRWIPSSPDQTPILDYAELGEKVGLMHMTVKELRFMPQPDRFGLEQTWTSFVSRYGQTDSRYEQLIRRIARDVELCEAVSDAAADLFPIHGDLGKWNLVFGSNGVRIIDFGELRIGNPLFDLAALLASTLDAADGQAEKKVSDCIRGYCLHMRRFFTRERLERQIRLWNVRGAVAILERNGLNEQTAHYAEKALNQHERFAALLHQKEEDSNER